MKDSQITLVQSSWHYAMQDQDRFISIVYDNLFEISPKTRLLFKRNLKMQQKKIMTTLGATIDSLDDPGSIMYDLIPIGMRHSDYNVSQEDFANFRTALLKAIKTILQDEYTAALEEAWIAIYKFIMDTMCSAMRASVNYRTKSDM
ncbi:MAG: globin domain-containing protein [Gammaproteobacteria bacterium]|nr:globin domain-containing protein [Gammaproteobacteria bacterium]